MSRGVRVRQMTTNGEVPRCTRLLLSFPMQWLQGEAQVPDSCSVTRVESARFKELGSSWLLLITSAGWHRTCLTARPVFPS
jgi:hypothetical protein